MPAFIPAPLLPSPRRRRRHRPPTPPTMTVQHVTTARDFAAMMPPNPSAALVVFSFVQRNCRACRYASRAYARMAEELARNQQVHVRFCEMDVTEGETGRLGRQLGVDFVPMWQFYKFREGGGGGGRGVGVLEEVVGPREVGTVREKVLEFAREGFDMDQYVFEDA
eukprot:GFKZ01015311.1.p4 GENE.GFKZ01015311.1~~GFKZ01015311.1.p4  ORF type:complete len:166 (-),score=25.94 GFKZ01015311.1:432-929(-)